MMRAMETGGLPAVLLECLEQGRVYLPSGDTAPLHSNVALHEAEELYHAVRELRPERTVEIGFAQGISAAAILKALEDNGQGEHVVIDPFQKDYAYAGPEMARRCGLEFRLRFFEKFAEDVLPHVERPVGFAFIDASHLFDLTMVDFVLMDKLLGVDRCLALHDLWMPSLQKVLRYVLANRDYELVKAPGKVATTFKHRISRLLRIIPKSDQIFSPETLHPWSGLGLGNMVILRKLSEDKRAWDFHRQF